MLKQPKLIIKLLLSQIRTYEKINNLSLLERNYVIKIKNCLRFK